MSLRLSQINHKNRLPSTVCTGPAVSLHLIWPSSRGGHARRPRGPRSSIRHVSTARRVAPYTMPARRVAAYATSVPDVA
eukprot:2637530-Rhodomonas_salina.1